MKTLEFGLSHVERGHLILVNASHFYKEYADREQLVSAGAETSPVCLEQQAAKMLSRIMVFLKCQQEIVPVSGYRTMQEQQKIYRDSLSTNGEKFTKQYVALPGCSEHQTGLAIDLAENRKEIDFIRPLFPYTGVCGRFRELAAQYGFVERYPAGKEEVTGIAHEPWHFRYVGYPHSALMRERELTLEEYIRYLKQFTYGGNHLYYQREKYTFEVFYVPVGGEQEAKVEIPDGVPYQVSGNNQDGVVVTIWRNQL